MKWIEVETWRVMCNLKCLENVYFEVAASDASVGCLYRIWRMLAKRNSHTEVPEQIGDI